MWRDTCVICGKPYDTKRKDGEYFCQSCYEEYGEEFHRCDCGAPLYGDEASDMECEECREHWDAEVDGW